ncbi:MAG TPA: DUF3857 and transglutaminase domain-containing protein [Candidatus Angelobacter sp.]|nr:DUF3857 and transglutaminase domain-containing protein [Candidatus Angelobacter sp.]
MLFQSTLRFLCDLCGEFQSFRRLAIICILVPVVCAAQKSEDWLPISPQDLKINSVPGEPGAAAIQLYYADYRDDIRREQFIYHRIKILREEGKTFGNVEIPVPPDYSMSSIQARTIHPDGRIIVSKDKPLEKLISRDREKKFTAKVVTLPAITVGSIIEYKYSLTWEKHLFDTTWMVQHNLYTVKESFWLGTYKGTITTSSPGDQTHLSYVYSNMPPQAVPRDTGNGIELQLDHVPAFKPEKYMPPEDNFRAEVHFFYGGREIESPEIFWQDRGREWHEKAERFIGDHQEIRHAAGEIVDNESNPEQKLRKLYARVQQIRNLSYERKRNRIEARKEDLKPNANVADVLTRGYGSQNEIAELFLALARAAGFEGGLLRAPSRKDRVFDSKLLSEKQLEKEIVSVKLNDKDVYLDPGTRFCPFGMVPWMYTSGPALRLNQDRGSFMVMPTPTADQSFTRRTTTASISTHGSLTGEIILEFKGNLALEHRLAAVETDDAGRRGDLEGELRDWLPKGSLVQLKQVQGWESSEDPLLAFFAVEVPGFAAVTGKHILAPANLFQSWERDDAFLPAYRQYPIWFPYTFEELDSLTLEIPQTYITNTIPKGQDVKLASTRFVTARSAQGNQLVQTRALVVNSIYFEPAKYAELREFFRKLHAADEEQTVLEAR